MSLTFEGLTFVWKISLLSGVVGFCVTAGVWCFCKVAKWAPVDITVNVYKTDTAND